MRNWTLPPMLSLAIAIATALSAGQARSDETAYDSVRDCMREVTKAERQAEGEDDTTALADNGLFDRARDLCMQTRYDMVVDMLGGVTREDGS